MLTLSIALAASAWTQRVDPPDPSVEALAPADMATARSDRGNTATTKPDFAEWFDFGGAGGQASASSSPGNVAAIQVLGTEQAHGLPPSTGSTTTFVPTTVFPIASPPTTIRSGTVPSSTVPPRTVPSSTAPPTTVPPTTAPATTPEARGRQALSRIRYDWVARLPDWSITFAPGRSGVMGYTYVDEKRIEVFVRDEMSDALLAHVVAHELGHAVDVSFNGGDDRAAWAAARGIETVQWWPGSGVTDFSTGAGDFAEAFAVWQVGAANFRSRAAGVPTPDQLALVASLANG